MNRTLAPNAASAASAAFRLMRWSLFCLWAVLVFLVVPDESAQAATFTVNHTADTVDAAPGNGVCADASDASGKCTLRAAIMESNALPGADTINVGPGVYTLILGGTGENGATTGDLDILGDLVLVGAGGNAEGDPAATVIQAGESSSTGIDRVIDINPNLDLNTNVTIQALTVRYGRGTDEYGAGIAADSGSGTIRIYNSVITNNHNVVAGGNGAGLYLSGGNPAGKLLVDKSRIDGNTSYNRGGGIFVEGVTPFIMTDTTVENNTATAGSGGGLFLIGGGQRTIFSSTIAGNSAIGTAGSSLDGLGGGVYSISKLNLDNSTVSGNAAVKGGGGLQLAYAVEGAYLVRNATIYGNTADSDNNASGSGGGIGVQAGTAAPLLHNTIVAGNRLGSEAASDIFGSAAGGSSYNLIGTGGSGGLVTGAAGNQTGVSDLRLGALADNGGPTKTHALLAGSPALDAGTAAQAPGAADQRGTAFARTADAADADTASAVDIGAFEAHPSVEDLQDVSMAMGGARQIEFHIGDADLGVDTVTAVSSDPQLIPNAAENLAVSGSGGARTLTVKPAPGQSGSATITVTVSHPVGGALRSMTDTFLVTVAPQPDLAITKTHTGNFRKGQPGAYTITVTNVGSASTSGGITIEDWLPAGLTFLSVEAAGWSCEYGQEPTKCTSGKALEPGESFDPIVLTVNVQEDAASTVTNRAVVSGGGDVNLDNNTALDSTVIKSSTSVSLNTSKTPSDYGERVTWTANVSADTGTPIGTVTFKDGSDVLGVASLSSGKAVYSSDSLAVGSHSITAEYNGSADYLGSVSPVVEQAVLSLATKTVVTALPTSSVFGQPVTFTAVVTAAAPASGTPTGTVTFKDGDTDLGTASLDGAGVATLPVNGLIAGTHRITAVYSGSATFAGSVSEGLDYMVERATTTLLKSSVTESVYGEKVTLTAEVKSAGGTPTGEVILHSGSTELGRGALGADGTTVISLIELVPGTYDIIASYSGDGLHAGSVSAPDLTLTVDRAATTTSVLSVSDAVYGESVTLTAEVRVIEPGAGKVGGTVSFLRDGGLLGDAPLDAGGTAVLKDITLPLGTSAITAVYGDGSPLYKGSISSPVEVTVRSPKLELDSYNYTLRLGENHTTVVRAVYGADDLRDVTGQSFFFSSNPSVAEVDAAGKVTAVGFGTANITVVYGSEQAVALVTVPIPNALNSNTALKSLTLTEGMAVLVPGTDTYEATVGSGVGSIGIQAETEDAEALVSINGSTAVEGTASLTADLSEGLNTFDIAVTAPDGSKKQYSLKITRERSSTGGGDGGSDNGGGGDNDGGTGNSGSGQPGETPKPEEPETPEVPWLIPVRPGGTVFVPLAVTVSHNGSTTVVSLSDGAVKDKLDGKKGPKVFLIALPKGAQRSQIEISSGIMALIRSGHQASSVGIAADGASFDLPVRLFTPDALAKALGISAADAEKARILITVTAKAAPAGVDAASARLYDFSIVVEAGGRTYPYDQYKGSYLAKAFGLKPSADVKKAAGITITGEATAYPVPFEKAEVEGSPVLVLKADHNGTFGIITQQRSFTDTDGTWAQDAIEGLSGRLVVDGYPDGSFRPEVPVSRSEFAAMLARALGWVPDSSASVQYTDVDPAAWDAGYIASMSERGLISGYEDGSFRGSQRITREEAAVLLTRALAYVQTEAQSAGAGTGSTAAFADSGEVSSYAREAIAKAQAQGLLSGYEDDTFKPQGLTNRAETVTLISKLLQLTGLAGS
ncbi:Ig-like domain repeat protein [Paenibacillus mucilaginosus]|uniref:SLH domain-containing protein n=1 Tax=Paenibacillus mucilaginosus (strain KNP414) TaxID=1036673 RepID=F8FNG7_PAEMK|nr:Ig-like domain repeat protein [Paenibacillus mucilaginosus]AEI39004.1 hypothetical protein KNP414_00379 [Paenibacillus mucilaginosus KNP414]MCG7216140.1 Ig-like domain repeat protein [Paenibacillus mucilaginosus]WDM28045.1 Ig-like domain repeat protein [Paenibacillus mucilaginosus]